MVPRTRAGRGVRAPNGTATMWRPEPTGGGERARRRTRRGPLILFALLVTPGWAAGQSTTAPTATQPVVTPFTQPVETRRTEPYPGLVLEYRRYDQPHPLRVWVARVDLRHKGIELAATCGADVGPDFETRSETTPEFAERRGVQLAVNASAFAPFRRQSGEPMQVVGLGACNGSVYSPPDERFGALIVRRDGTVRIANPPYEFEKIAEAVSGFHMLVENGRDVVERSARRQRPGFVGVNPRTAVGIDKDGGTLFLAVFDGRQKGVSEGITLHELGRFFLDLGAYHALNMDGGGSTTMVLQHPGTGRYELVNTPVGRGEPGSLRRVANNLGVHLPSPPSPKNDGP